MSTNGHHASPEEVAEINATAGDHADKKRRDVEDIQNYLAKPVGIANGSAAAYDVEPPPVPELLCKNASSVNPEPIQWLWAGVIARGCQTLVAGAPGLGKSQATLSFAATVSSGGTWPDGSRCAQGRVILISAEDDAKRTVRPRLDAAGADVSMVELVDGVFDPDRLSSCRVANASFNLVDYVAALGAKIENYGDVALVVIDPISAYLGGVDSHKNSDVRALLMKLDDIADKHRVAILCVTHLNKARGGSAMSRFMGSTAFIAAARAGYLVTRDDGDSVTRRLWTTTKNNLAPDEYATAFDVEGATVDSMAGPISTSRVV